MKLSFYYKRLMLGIIMDFDISIRLTSQNPPIICLNNTWGLHLTHAKQDKLPTNETKGVETYYEKSPT